MEEGGPGLGVQRETGDRPYHFLLNCWWGSPGRHLGRVLWRLMPDSFSKAHRPIHTQSSDLLLHVFQPFVFFQRIDAFYLKYQLVGTELCVGSFLFPFPFLGPGPEPTSLMMLMVCHLFPVAIHRFHPSLQTTHLPFRCFFYCFPDFYVTDVCCFLMIFLVFCFGLSSHPFL